MRLHVLTTALFLTLPHALAAQSHPLVGTWDVTIPAGARVQGGITTPIMANGTLTFSAEHDSLIGQLKVQRPEGFQDRPPTRLAAKLGATPSIFLVSSEAKINTNGVESVRKVSSTYTIAATGDTLSGTVEHYVEGEDMPMSGPQSFGGKRAKPAG
jgi:hypothetical protein